MLMSISVTLISDNYSSTFISLWITFYRQISLKMKLYPPVIVTWFISSASFSNTDNCFYSSSSFDLTTVSESVEFWIAVQPATTWLQDLKYLK